jgi:hypothetical protein
LFAAGRNRLPIGGFRLKRAELEHDHRLLLRGKLGAFFSRKAKDVADELKLDRPDDPSALEWVDPPPEEEGDAQDGVGT